MDTSVATELLGAISPQTFMRRHWQKKPLLVRQAVPGGIDLVSRADLFALAAHDEVESRLVEHREGAWSPAPGAMLPPRRGGGRGGGAGGEGRPGSWGFGARGGADPAGEVMQRSLAAPHADGRGPLSRAPDRAATATPARVPDALQA